MTCSVGSRASCSFKSFQMQASPHIPTDRCPGQALPGLGARFKDLTGFGNLSGLIDQLPLPKHVHPSIPLHRVAQSGVWMTRGVGGAAPLNSPQAHSLNQVIPDKAPCAAEPGSILSTPSPYRLGCKRPPAMEPPVRTTFTLFTTPSRHRFALCAQNPYANKRTNRHMSAGYEPGGP